MTPWLLGVGAIAGCLMAAFSGLAAGVLLYLVWVNAQAAVVTWWDKRQARRNGWRVRESHLFLLTLAGGSPAAFFAMRQLRHKTSSLGFKITFWSIVAIQVVALILVSYWALYSQR